MTPRVVRLVLTSLVLAASAPGVGAQGADTLRTAGLRAPVTLTRDRAGVVHIAAGSEHDLFFAQGWNVARDRLFQLELWRRRASGTMAELVGPRGLAADRASRLFQFRGDLTKDLAVYHPRGRSIVQAFVDGINAYIAETERSPALLSPEFGMLGLRPGRWTPAIVISRHNGLFLGASGESQMARLVAAVGAEKAAMAYDIGPAAPRLHQLQLDAAALPTDQFTTFFTGLRGPLAFQATDLVAGASRGGAAADDASALRHLNASQGMPDALPLDGSNNWVVAGSRTASGKPLLANDPHRAVTAPSLRYLVHLQAPGWNVIGGGEPALPGVSIGHNAAGAWGLTIFSIDGEDLLEYETDPARPSYYRYRGAWVAIREVVEVVPVKGAAATSMRLRFTRHGPVIAEDTVRHRAWALRTTAHETGTAPYLASLRMSQATTWAEFQRACTYAFAPAENMIWADTSGAIGWQVVGKAPRRTTFSGLLPMPGDGRYEWNGFLPVADLPHDANPAKGFLHSANEDNVPAGYPHLDAVGFDWADKWRADRIAEVLRSARGLTVKEMTALQYDGTSMAARLTVPLVRRPTVAAGFTTAELAARDTVVAWDQQMVPSSVGAAIYALYEKALQRHVAEYVLAPAARALGVSLEVVVVTNWLTKPISPAGSSAEGARDSLVAVAFSSAVQSMTRRFGPSMSGWQYGQATYKRVVLHHPLGAALDSAALRTFEVGPLPMGGDGNTVWATGGTDVQGHGASFRIVVDLADFDRSVGTNTPGQSGDVRSPHYRDLFAPWVAGTYFPLPYSPAAIARAAEQTTVLRP